MIRLNSKKTVDFVISSEKKLPKENQTIFKLKPLTVEEESEVMDALFNSGKPTPYKQYATAFRLGVSEITGLINDNGDSVEYSKFDESVAEMIPRNIRDEVALEVIKSLSRTKEDVKN